MSKVREEHADRAVFVAHQEELAAAEDPNALFKQLLEVYSTYARLSWH